jgi:hypothetical protein
MVYFSGASTLKSGKPRPQKRPYLDPGEDEAKREEHRRKLEKWEEEKEKQLAEGEKEEDDEEEEPVKNPSNPTSPQLPPSTYTHNSIPTYKDAVELKPQPTPPALPPHKVMIRDLSLSSLPIMPRPLLVPDFPDTPWLSTAGHSVVPRRPSTPSQSVGPRPPMHSLGRWTPQEPQRPRRVPSEPSSTVTEPDSTDSDSDPDDKDEVEDELSESLAPPYAEKVSPKIRPQARTTFILRGRYIYREDDQTTPAYKTSLPVQSQSAATKSIDFLRVEPKPVVLPDKTPAVFPAYRPRRLYKMERTPFFYQSRKTGIFKTGYNMSLKGRGSAGVGRKISVSKRRWAQRKGYRAVTKWTQKDWEDSLDDACQRVINVKRGLRPLNEYLWMDSSETPLGKQVEVSTERGAEHRFEVWVPVVTRRLMEAMVALWTFLVWDLALGRGAETPGSPALRLC